MTFDPNPLYYYMLRLFSEKYDKQDKIEIYNEGSSRSSKTWDAFHLIYTFCDHNRGGDLDIFVLRFVLKDCRESTYKDFKKLMKIIGVEEPDITYMKENQEPTVRLFGNNIYFRGLADEANKEGYPSDIVFFNEMLEIPTKSWVSGIIMRCRIMVLGDWNPKFTQHWAFDLEHKPNAYFTRTTYKQNKHLQKAVINEIESYCPWNFEDLELDESKRRPNTTNIENGTADKYRWMVYGEGIRSAPEGLIFNNVRYIDQWPEDVAHVYGQDFGFTTDPSALVKVGEKESESRIDIYMQLLLYEPTPTPDMLHNFYEKIGLTSDDIIVADSSDKYAGDKGVVEMVRSLQAFGWSISKVSKTKSIIYWLAKMGAKSLMDSDPALSKKIITIHIINNHLVPYARKEQENYRLKVINGIAINQPIDKFNHFWDGGRYGFMSLNAPNYELI